MSSQTTDTRPRLEQVRAAVEGVADPELPVLTIGMLGMVHAVTVDSRSVEVELLPTFSGCPATDVIAEDVRAAVGEVVGVEQVVVRFRHDPPWTPDRITPAGHDALREFGIAPPSGAGPGSAAVTPPAPGGRASLPLVGLPVLGPETASSRPCPYCGSTDTVRDGMFGPTPCRDVRFCNACRQPFEGFKS